MQLQKLIRDTINSTLMIEGETAQEYIERTYHMAMMAWERVPESEKAPDGAERTQPDSEPEEEVQLVPTDTETKEALPSQALSPQATTSLDQ